MARRSMSFDRTTKDEPVRTKTNRGRSTTTRRTPRSLPRNVAKEMDPKGPPKGTKSSLERSKPTADAMTVTKTATKPKADAKATPKVAAPPKVTKRPQVTGKGTDKASRNVSREGPMGKRTLANVTREQLLAAGLTTGRKGLNTYLNKFDELGRRPKPSDFKKPAEKKSVRRTGSARPMSERKFANGGMMKSKMKPKGMMAGGKMKSKMSTKGGMRGGKKIPPGMKKGGTFPDLNKDGKVTQADILMGRGVVKKKAKAKKATADKKPAGKRTMMPGMTSAKMPKIKGAEGIDKKGVYQKGGSIKPKGMKAGGKPKGYAAGGMKSKMATKKKPTKQKVRGAGIARKGVRPAKMR